MRLAHKGSATMLLLQKAFIDERFDCLANGATAYVKQIHQAVLGRDALPRSPFLGEDF